MRPSEFHIEFDGQHTVVFDLVDHTVVTAWAYLLEGYWLEPVMELEQTNRGFSDETYDEAVAQMNRLAPSIRQYFSHFFDDDFLQLLEKPDITRDDLNVIHDGYERVQAFRLTRPDDDLIPEQTLLAQELNETVHYMERFFENDTICPMCKASPRVRIRMLHNKFKWSGLIMMPYQEKDFELFELYRPGHLYLTYTKVGKPPLSLFRDHDNHAEEPVPWKLFGPSFNFTLFGPDPVDDFDEARAWLLEHTGRDDWVLGDPRIGTLRGDPYQIWKKLGNDPQITNLSFIYQA